MSSINPWFFNSLSLKFLASVKAVEVIWRQSEAEAEMRNYFKDFVQQPRAARPPIEDLQRTVTRKFESFADKLLLAKPLKDNLCFFVHHMFKPTLEWLLHYLCELRNQADANAAEKGLYHVSNILFDNVGYVDSRKMLESYVSNKDTIDFFTWTQLCDCCSEDYIRKFAETVDWEEAKFNVNYLPIYWYYKIFNIFPRENMFEYAYYLFQDQRAKGRLDEDNINCTLFLKSVSSESFPAVKYFWNKLTGTERLKLSMHQQFLPDEDGYCYETIVAYLLGGMEFHDWPSEDPMNCRPWKYLLNWPWVLFINDWIDAFKDKNIDTFVAMFRVLARKRLAESRKIDNEMRTMYYVPCAKLWTLCREKFGLTCEVMAIIVGLIFRTEDIILCTIVLSGSTTAFKKRCIQTVGRVYREFPHYVIRQGFYNEFAEKILVNDEERLFFDEIFGEILLYT